eukprot:CAMPEP_0204361360 /NCGR_PEP_ID=MMETSP0469-20131031/38767_1 /ASSEMBLY_ACC=CAM_ASM_000384 /TAXON_ID=2969 /ORGANISM="Oxyrrhis marina" /LENGTH=70 /DNA_ID=CAMNT_0051349743 /DNA_START=140 /DNA_END=350 /DNA_ORIENTATION=+
MVQGSPKNATKQTTTPSGRRSPTGRPVCRGTWPLSQHWGSSWQPPPGQLARWQPPPGQLASWQPPPGQLA